MILKKESIQPGLRGDPAVTSTIFLSAFAGQCKNPSGIGKKNAKTGYRSGKPPREMQGFSRANASKEKAAEDQELRKSGKRTEAAEDFSQHGGADH